MHINMQKKALEDTYREKNEKLIMKKIICSDMHVGFSDMIDAI